MSWVRIPSLTPKKLHVRPGFRSCFREPRLAVRRASGQCDARTDRPRMLRQTVVTTMLDACVGLRDMQIAAPHADPRTTMHYDQGAQEPLRASELHPRYVLGLGLLMARFGVYHWMHIACDA